MPELPCPHAGSITSNPRATCSQDDLRVTARPRLAPWELAGPRSWGAPTACAPFREGRRPSGAERRDRQSETGRTDIRGSGDWKVAVRVIVVRRRGARRRPHAEPQARDGPTGHLRTTTRWLRVNSRAIRRVSPMQRAAQRKTLLRQLHARPLGASWTAPPTALVPCARCTVSDSATCRARSRGASRESPSRT